MTVREFFENGGVVRCESEQEDAAVIEHCRDAGLAVFPKHDPKKKYWGLTLFNGHISGYMVGSPIWEDGTPYNEFLLVCGLSGSVPPLDDLI